MAEASPKKPCSHFSKTGSCRYGNGCRYSHSKGPVRKNPGVESNDDRTKHTGSVIWKHKVKDDDWWTYNRLAGELIETHFQDDCSVRKFILDPKTVGGRACEVDLVTMTVKDLQSGQTSEIWRGIRPPRPPAYIWQHCVQSGSDSSWRTFSKEAIEELETVHSAKAGNLPTAHMLQPDHIDGKLCSINMVEKRMTNMSLGQHSDIRRVLQDICKLLQILNCRGAGVVVHTVDVWQYEKSGSWKRFTAKAARTIEFKSRGHEKKFALAPSDCGGHVIQIDFQEMTATYVMTNEVCAIRRTGTPQATTKPTRRRNLEPSRLRKPATGASRRRKR